MPESGSRLPGILSQNGLVELVALAEESASAVALFEFGAMSLVFDRHLEQVVLIHHCEVLDILHSSKDLSCLYPPQYSQSLWQVRGTYI